MSGRWSPARNPKKLAELRRVLDAAGVSGLTLLSLDDVPPFDEAPETGATFEENALAKARDAFAATGIARGRRRFRSGGRRAQRDAGGAQRALVRAARRRRRQHRAAARPARRRARRAARRGVRVGVRAGVRGGRVRQLQWSAGSGRAASSANPAATADSATTRCSCPRVRTGPPRSSVPRRRTRRRTGAGRWRRCCRRCGRFCAEASSLG